MNLCDGPIRSPVRVGRTGPYVFLGVIRSFLVVVVVIFFFLEVV